MKTDINSTQLIKYPFKNNISLSGKIYTRILKAILPRKRTSKLRISHNRSWNQDEDRCYVCATHFSKIDFCNEINDNSINEAIIESQLQKNGSYQCKASGTNCTDIGATEILYTQAVLTPPATPFENSVSFGFDSNTTFSNVSSLVQSDVLPPTPATLSNESDVFTFHDHSVHQSISISDNRALFLKSLLS